jgi:hypothetical protein
MTRYKNVRANRRPCTSAHPIIRRRNSAPTPAYGAHRARSKADVLRPFLVLQALCPDAMRASDGALRRPRMTSNAMLHGLRVARACL